MWGILLPVLRVYCVDKWEFEKFVAMGLWDSIVRPYNGVTTVTMGGGLWQKKFLTAVVCGVYCYIFTSMSTLLYGHTTEYSCPCVGEVMHLYIVCVWLAWGLPQSCPDIVWESTLRWKNSPISILKPAEKFGQSNCPNTTLYEASYILSTKYRRFK